jgi:hypothetical protein
MTERVTGKAGIYQHPQIDLGRGFVVIRPFNSGQISGWTSTQKSRHFPAEKAPGSQEQVSRDPISLILFSVCCIHLCICTRRGRTVRARDQYICLSKAIFSQFPGNRGSYSLYVVIMPFNAYSACLPTTTFDLRVPSHNCLISSSKQCKSKKKNERLF